MPDLISVMKRRAAKTLAEVGGRLYLNSSRLYLEDFAQRAADSVSCGAIVLDAGAGNAPYGQLFQHVVYETADRYVVGRSPTYRCDLCSIPVPTERYDLVLATQVLEHVPDPLATLTELKRVLKRQGTLWLTAPLFYEEHMIPHDYYRYTQFGLRHLVTRAGFDIEKIEALEGYYGTLSYECEVAARSLSGRSADYGSGILGTALSTLAILTKPLLLVTSFGLAKLDRRTKYSRLGHAKNYSVIARKTT